MTDGFSKQKQYSSKMKEANEKVQSSLIQNQKLISEVFNEIKELVLSKNRQYGDSVLEPKRYFSSAPTDEQIKVRIDDKINRLVLGDDSLESDNDIVKDLIGYLTLLLVYRRKK
jgi:pyruvate carboxylase